MSWKSAYNLPTLSMFWYFAAIFAAKMFDFLKPMTRTLDLFFTINPTLVDEVGCRPCLSDYDMVYDKYTLKSTTQKQKTRRFFYSTKLTGQNLKF